MSEQGQASSRPALFTKMSASEVPIQMGCWYFSILIPTCVSKYLYLDFVYLHGISDAFGPLTEEPSGAKRYLYLLAFFSRDFLEVFVIVALLLLSGRVFLRRGIGYLMSAFVFLCLLILGANYVALEKLYYPLTIDILELTMRWAKDNPQILRPLFAPKNIALIALAVLWSALPLFATRKLAPLGSRNAVIRFLPGVVLLLFLAGSFTLPPLVLTSYAKSALPLRGHWSNSFSFFLELGHRHLIAGGVQTPSQIQADFRSLVYPNGSNPKAGYLIGLPAANLRRRHIVVVTLETAPRQYYPITNNPSLPTFHRMSEHAIVSDRHYANSLMSLGALHSILTGTYSRVGGRDVRWYVHIKTDGLASVLSRHGYVTTFIGSYPLGWLGGDILTRWFNSLGFKNIIDFSSRDLGKLDPYELQLRRESLAFESALETVLRAEAKGQKALVYVNSGVGHFPWKSKPEEEGLPAEEKFHLLSRFFDERMGNLLLSLQGHGLTDQVLILVVGDHGFRSQEEFGSLGQKFEYGDRMFNVPFLLYAPGLLKGQVSIPYVTSHVDIVPTLLELVGIPTDSLFQHGENMLNRRLRDRVTFTTSFRHIPLDGFHWNGHFYVLNNLTGQMQITSDAPIGEATSASPGAHESTVLSKQEVTQILEKAKALFEATLASFLHPKTQSQ